MPPLDSDLIRVRRDAHVFAERPDLMDRLEPASESVLLAADQLLQARTPRDYIVRRGKLRVTEFMSDGREITRAVLQAGAVLQSRHADGLAADPRDDRYLVRDLVLMALGEVEMWVLPAEAVEITA